MKKLSKILIGLIVICGILFAGHKLYKRYLTLPAKVYTSAGSLYRFHRTFTITDVSDSKRVKKVDHRTLDVYQTGTVNVTLKTFLKTYHVKLVINQPKVMTTAVTKNGQELVQLSLKNKRAQPFVSSNMKIASVTKQGLVIPRQSGQVTLTSQIGQYKVSYPIAITKSTINNKVLYLIWGRQGNTITTLNHFESSVNSYFAIDNFIDYQITYQKVNGLRSGKKSKGQFLTKNTKYTLSFVKAPTSLKKGTIALSETKLIRLEKQEAKPFEHLTSLTNLGVAHKGFSNAATGNTTEAFKLAAKSPYFYGIETDIYNTKDGVLVIVHSDTMQRTVDIKKSDPNYNKSINEVTYKTLQKYDIKDAFGKIHKGEHMPTLRSYLKICKQYKKKAFIEIKGFDSPKYYQKLVDLIYEEKMENDTCLISSKYGWLENIKATIPKASKLKYLGIYLKACSDTDFNYLRQNGFNGMNQFWRAATLSEMEKAKKYGLAYGIWTVFKDPKNLNVPRGTAFYKLKIQFITTNGTIVFDEMKKNAKTLTNEQARERIEKIANSSLQPPTTMKAKREEFEANDDTKPAI